MADRLFLSCRVRGFTATNMLRHFERLLGVFPFSRLSKVGGVLRILPVSDAEPPLIEASFDQPVVPAQVIAQAREFSTADCSVELDAAWDLWQYSKDWEVAPAPVTLTCFGPEFTGSDGDHMRIDFGLDALFLPEPELPNHLFMVRSNIRSLLHLVAELDRNLNFESRRLWSESGENFAERVESTLQESGLAGDA